jgi:dihydrofolate reductase
LGEQVHVCFVFFVKCEVGETVKNFSKNICVTERFYFIFAQPNGYLFLKLKSILMKKLVWFMHVSLDGFVAGPNGDLGWAAVDEAIFGYVGQRAHHSGMALYGRVTWEMMEAYWPTAADKPNPTRHEKEHSAWYAQVKKIVLSRSKQGDSRPLTTFIGENMAEQIQQLKQGGEKEIVLFGSPTAGKSLLQAGLVDELWLFVNPILLGKGIPMFPELNGRVKLTLAESRCFENGVLCLHYNIAG